MKIAGIDPSLTSTGVVILEDDNPMPVYAACIKSDKETSKIFRATWIGQKCVEMLTDNAVEIAYVESPALGYAARNSNIRADLAGLFYRVMGDVSIINGIPARNVPPKALKFFATKNGKASKDQMVEAVPDDVIDYFLSLGYKKSTGIVDLCDAYHLARFHFKEE
jgi:Holliday junction resolvasome RuvABC endonuclease subunit